MVGRGVGRDVVNDLQGRLGEGVLANLVQYLSLNQASGCLDVVGDGCGSGHLYLRGGSVEHVEVGVVAGLPALTELLGWRQGRFVFHLGVDAPRRTLALPVDALLLHASYGSDVNGAATGAVVGHHRQGTNGMPEPSALTDPTIASGLVWAAVAVAGPIGEIFVDEAFQAIGHSPRLLPESALGQLLQAVAAQFTSNQGRQQFLARAEAVMAHHGYGRVEDDR